MDTLNKALNKGVPSAIDIVITTKDMYDLCSNKTLARQEILKAETSFQNACEEIIKRSFAYLHSNSTILISTDPKTFTKTITISPERIMNIIIFNLDIGKISRQMENGEVADMKYPTKEEVEERLERLGKVQTEKELKREFPQLYFGYEAMINEKAKLLLAKKRSFFEYMDHIKKRKHNKYDIEALEEITTFKEFIEYTKTTIKALYDHQEELVNIALQQKIDSRVFGMNTSKKLELYLANYMVEIAASDETDQDTKQKCSYFLSTYLFENQDSLDDGLTVESLITNYANHNKVKSITKRDVYDKYRQLLINNPSLFNVNLDYHIFNDMEQSEIDELMASYLETLKLKWEIIANNDDITIPSDTEPNNGIHIYDQNGEIRQSPKKTQEELKELFYQKKQFFDSTEPLLRVMGKETFNGYIGYIYPSGKVILDKYYESSEAKQLADEVAIYCMDIDDFYRLSQLSKSEIIRDRLCKRFYHRGDWQQRVSNEINSGIKSDISDKIHVLKKLDTTIKK